MTFISANGSLVEPYQIEILQKAVASDLSSTEEASVAELLAREELLLEQEETNDTTGTVGSSPTNRKKAKS